MRRRFILTSGFISSVRFIISLYARRLRGRPSLPSTCNSVSLLFLLLSSGPYFHLSLFEWLNYSDMCKWVVFIFLPWKWKLKVTQRDPHLLLKLNCSECAVWIIVAMQGFVNPARCTASAAAWKNCRVTTHTPRFYKAPFEYSPQNKSNHVGRTGPGQGPALGGNTSLRWVFEDPFGASKFLTPTEGTWMIRGFHLLSV